jgi:hypothetical protein
MFNLIQATVITILVLYLLVALIIIIYKYNGNYKLISFKVFIEFIVFGIMLALIITNEALNIFTGIGIFSLILKTYFASLEINDVKYQDNNYFKNIFKNILYIFNDKKIDSMSLLKKYLPVAILNGFLMVILYIYTVTKLRVDLSLASNCLTSNFNVEYATIRHKVRTFAKFNNANIIKFLGLIIFSFSFAIFSILYIYYYENIELHYVIILPILLFIVVLSIILIDKIDGNNLGKDTSPEKKHGLKTEGYILSTIISIIVFPMIGILCISFLL